LVIFHSIAPFLDNHPETMASILSYQWIPYRFLKEESFNLLSKEGMPSKMSGSNLAIIY